jgi:hypothetical protein
MNVMKLVEINHEIIMIENVYQMKRKKMKQKKMKIQKKKKLKKKKIK